MEIEHIISAIRGSQIRISNYADDEAVDDDLTYEEICFLFSMAK